jgi:hypothetical protein
MKQVALDSPPRSEISLKSLLIDTVFFPERRREIFRVPPT